MKYLQILGVIAIVGLMTACTTPEQKAAKSQTAVNEKKLELTKQYEECSKKAMEYEAMVKEGKGDTVAEGDRVTAEECETIRKTLDALK